MLVQHSYGLLTVVAKHKRKTKSKQHTCNDKVSSSICVKRTSSKIY